jgi:hypothetical protein
VIGRQALDPRGSRALVALSLTLLPAALHHFDQPAELEME